MSQQTTFLRTETKFCHNCGEQIKMPERFCQFCGIEQIRISGTQPQNEPKIKAENAQHGYIPSQNSDVVSDRPLEDLGAKITKIVNRIAEKIEEGTKKIHSKIEEKNREMQAKMEAKERNIEYELNRVNYKIDNTHLKMEQAHVKPKKKVKKPKKPMNESEMTAGGIFGIIFWGLLMYSNAMGNHNFLGSQFLNWLNIAATFGMYFSIMNLTRGLFGPEHYYIQSIVIIAHTVLALYFIPYILQFEAAFWSIPNIETINTDVVIVLKEIFAILPRIIVLIVYISFVVSIVEAIRFPSKYKHFF